MNPEPQPDAGRQVRRHGAKPKAGQSFWSQLGLPETEYIADELAPEIDEAILLRLVRQELSEEVARSLYRLIYSFSSWHQAYSAVLIDELKKLRKTASP